MNACAGNGGQSSGKFFGRGRAARFAVIGAWAILVALGSPSVRSADPVVGRLMGLGTRGAGQFGDGQAGWVTTPTVIATDVAQVAHGDWHALYLKTDGTLWAAGSNYSGQVGDPTTTTRSVPALIAQGVRHVACGRSTSLFVKSDGTLWGMGRNGAGQLGQGNTAPQPLPVPIATDVSQAAGSLDRTFFVKTDGTLWGMGAIPNGWFGVALTPPILTPALFTTGVRQVAVGDGLLLYVKTDDTLWSVERSGATVQIASNVATCGLARQVENGFFFVKNDRTLWVQGSNEWFEYEGFPGRFVSRLGRFGLGDVSYASSPTLLTGDVVAVAAGSAHLVVAKADGTVWNTGSNSQGQFGDGTMQRRSTLGLDWMAGAVSQVVAGAETTLVLTSDGTVYGAGSRHYGSFGDGYEIFMTSPSLVADDVVDFAVDEVHAAWIRADGTLWAAGLNRDGQLGDGTTLPRSTPVQVDTGVVAVATGPRHSAWVKTDGTLWTVGANPAGELGDGTTTSRVVPVQIAGDAVDVAVGAHFTVFRRTDGTLWGCGANDQGQLGDGTRLARSVPVLIATDVVAASAGHEHTVWVKTDGTLWATGGLGTGDGLGGSRDIPVQVATGVASVSAGYAHSLMLKTDGTVWATGANHVGQLGDGTTVTRTSFVPIASGAQAVAAGTLSSYFATTDGSLWACGHNSWGQLGDGAFVSRSTPVRVVRGAGITRIRATAGSAFFLQQPLPPTITFHPPSQATDQGYPLPLEVEATGAAPFTYQWYRGASGDTTQPIAGATQRQYVTLPVQAPAAYWVRVTNAFGTADSTTAEIAVNWNESFAVWSAHAGLPAGQDGPLDDPDGDGLSNLAEYAFRSSPTAAASRAAPTDPVLVTFGATEHLGLLHREYRGAQPHVTFGYELSTDLTNWTGATFFTSLETDDADGDTRVLVRRVWLELPPGTARAFARVRVAATP